MSNMRNINRSPKKIDPVLVIGLVISLAVGVFMILIGQDQLTSFLVGLIGASITLIVDLTGRLNEVEHRILKSVKLGELISKDDGLHAIINQIVDSYVKIQRGGFDLFAQRSTDALDECRDVLAGLERGSLTTSPGSKYTYGRKGVTKAQKIVKAVAYEDIESWRTEHLRNVVKVNEDAVQRGVLIQRVFILTKDTLAKASDVLDLHQKAGVQVFIISPEELPNTELLESFLIVDDKFLVVFHYTRDGHKFTGERVSIEPVELDKAISNFDTIILRAKPYRGNDEKGIQ